MELTEELRRELVDEARRACASAVRRLQDAGVAPEGLAAHIPEGRRLRVLRRPATMEPRGEAWRLGVLLLGTDGQLYRIGRSTRAAERGRVGYQSVSREERKELAAAALRGGYPVGTPVNFDAAAIDLGALATDPDPGGGPLGFAEGALRVRWHAGAPLSGGPTLVQYLAERAGLLIDPLPG